MIIRDAIMTRTRVTRRLDDLISLGRANSVVLRIFSPKPSKQLGNSITAVVWPAGPRDQVHAADETRAPRCSIERR